VALYTLPSCTNHALSLVVCTATCECVCVCVLVVHLLSKNVSYSK
jgi:hypothetical protein